MSRKNLIQLRRGTAAEWTSANPTLASGEGGFETDTKKLKIGDGSTAWNSLAYIGTGGSPTGSAGGALDGSYPNPGLASTVAGNGLAETSDVLSVNVDGSTIEISSDSLRVKASGITANEIAADAVGTSEVAPGAVTETEQTLADVTTLNASTSAHGYLKKLDNNSAHFMDGQGNWSTPSGSGAVASDVIWDAKGDLAVGSGADAADNLAVGSDGQVLTADSAQTLGVKWAAAAGGGSGIPDHGWTDHTATTWTYASGSGGGTATFTTSGDLTTVFEKGVRVRLKQGGAYKYFVVIGSSFAASTTTVTITGGSDYTLANSSITDNYYSRVQQPQGYPSWFNFASATTGITSPSHTSKFCVVGGMCTIEVALTGTSNATTKTFTLPVPVGTAGTFQSAILVRDNGVTQNLHGRMALPNSGSTANLFKDPQGNAWTNTGTWFAIGTLAYDI